MTINKNGRWDCKVLKEQPPLDGTMQLSTMKRIAATGLPWCVRDQKTGIVMLLCDAQNLREVALFPMNQKAEDLLMGAPSEASTKQLRELHLRLNLPEK